MKMPLQIMKNHFFTTNHIILNLPKNLKMIHQIQKKNLIRKIIKYFILINSLNKEINKITEGNKSKDKEGKKQIIF